MGLWRSKRRAKGLVGVELNPDGIAIAVRRGTSEDIELVDFRPYDDGHAANGERLTRALRPLVARHKLSNYDCNLVLGNGDYSIHLTEAPDVTPEELAEATRWRIAELITYPVEDVVVEVLALPENLKQFESPMVYAVVAQNSHMQRLAEAVNESRLTLKRIDIRELALRNLGLFLDPETTGFAVVHVDPDKAHVYIFRDGDLCLAHQCAFEALTGPEDLAGQWDALMREVQRSLEYFERQLGQSVPRAIYFGGQGITDSRWVERFQSDFAPRFRILNDQSRYPTTPPRKGEDTTSRCLGAIGGALHG